MLLSWLADRYGRRTAIQFSLFMLALPSLAAALATAWAANRLGSAIAPLVLLPLGMCGVMLVLISIGATLAINLALVLIFGPRGLAGRPLAA